MGIATVGKNNTFYVGVGISIIIMTFAAVMYSVAWVREKIDNTKYNNI